MARIQPKKNKNKNRNKKHLGSGFLFIYLFKICDVAEVTIIHETI
jgi:hypothetical protein